MIKCLFYSFLFFSFSTHGLFSEDNLDAVKGDLLSYSHLALIKSKIRTVKDYPRPGLKFRDITPLLSDPQAFRIAIDFFAKRYQKRQIDAILGLESRGLIFGATLAYRLGLPFVPVRKKGSLPGEVISVEYQREFGPEKVEILKETLEKNQRVVVVDDLLFTGATADATCQLARKAGVEVEEVACLVRIEGIGEKPLSSPVFNLVNFEKDE